MPIEHTEASPGRLPFHAESFGWEHFERFCAACFVSGTSLPNLNLAGDGPARLRIVDAVRYGTTGSKQRGIDILATMENLATWVVQCKRVQNFTQGDARKAIAKAEAEFGNRNPARYLLWVSGKVVTAALDLVHEHHPNWTLWDGERLSLEFLLHSPRKQAFQIITNLFGVGYAKAFFPLPDNLLFITSEFFSRWDGEERLFHHDATFVGRADVLDRLTRFAVGGKGRKAVIVSAPGGIGKTRLLRAVAEQVEAEAPARFVRFINPDAPDGAEPPRDEEASHMTVFHDDAHRMDMSGLLVSLLARKGADGSRLVLSTRPGAEDGLRERLMKAGYPSADIDPPLVIKGLNRAEMVQLAASRLGEMDASVARSLAALSNGCALITLVGAELLRRGDLTNLDLNRSSHFRHEVFLRFEGQELDRLRGRLEKPLMVKLLRSIALLSPWDHRDQKHAVAMSEYLGIQRGQVDAACDSLLEGGLLIRTHHGLRITPDLFSDHLVYSACYDEAGNLAESIEPFLACFQELHSQTILNNLAGAEWRAVQEHGSAACSVVAPIWNRFLEGFAAASFWERSQMLERWSAFAVYQPLRSLELATRAMDLNTAEGKTGHGDFDRHDQVLRHVPGLLRPVAIWSDDHRQSALETLWCLRRDFPMGESMSSRDRFADFATIASFSHDNPPALTGVMGWLDQLMESEDAALVADKPCLLFDVALRPFFAQVIKRTFNQDNRTVVFSTIPVSISKTRLLRDRALKFITEKAIPRGTVATMNVLPALAEAYRQTEAHHDLPEAVERAWRPERFRALSLIAELAKKCPHPLIHYSIRHQLRWQVTYGKDEMHRTACLNVINSMPDTFELRLARLTLSWSHDDLFEPYDKKQHEDQWQALLQGVACKLIMEHPTAIKAHGFLNEWSRTCAEHGLTTHLGELLNEIARQNHLLGCEMLDVILESQGSELAGNAANLIRAEDWQSSVALEEVVRRALESLQPAVVRSFLNSIQFDGHLQSAPIQQALFHLAGRAEASVLQRLFAMIAFPSKRDWTDDLALTLLNRALSDDEAQDLADALWRKVRYGDGGIYQGVIVKLMDRLVKVIKFKESYDEAGFIYGMGERFPRHTFEMFVKRIQRQEREHAGGRMEFRALPYGRRQSLAGIELEPDFEDLARGILDNILQRKHEDRDPWQRLFAMTVSRSSPLIEPLLMECLVTASSGDDLADIATLTGFEGSLVVFRHPRLVEAILKKARTFAPDVYERTTWKLIHGAGPQSRSYRGGELEPQYRYLRDEAEKAARLHGSDPILSAFYQKIVEMEVADADRSGRWQEAVMAAEW